MFLIASMLETLAPDKALLIYNVILEQTQMMYDSEEDVKSAAPYELLLLQKIQMLDEDKKDDEMLISRMSALKSVFTKHVNVDNMIEEQLKGTKMRSGVKMDILQFSELFESLVCM